jgi:hypothetical protein
MALTIQLPLQSTQYIPTSNSFNAVFNTVSPGRYSFNTPGNQNVVVIPLEIGSIYLVERMFISGNLNGEDYLSSVDDLSAAGMPQLQIRRKQNKVCSHVAKIPVIQFTQNREAPIYIYSDKKDDSIIMSMSGELQQIGNTVGLDPIIITVGLSIYQINEKYYNQGIRTRMNPDFGLGRKDKS